MADKTDTVSIPLTEYQDLVKALPDGYEPSDVVAALVKDAEWTDKGATAIEMLASQYGAFVLRNALALAMAQGFEDGELEI